MMTKIFVAYHCQWKIFQNNIYQPMLVGAQRSNVQLPILKDNTGENISEKNPDFCELTMLYWMWKNLQLETNDIVGMCHYRRFFDVTMSPWKRFVIRNFKRKDPYMVELESFDLQKLEKTDFRKILNNHDVILTKMVRCKKSWNENVDYYTPKHLQCLRDAIVDLTPQYLGTYDKVMSGREMAPRNMFVAKADFLNNYSKWLFDVLFKTEELINQRQLEYRPRLYGYLSEMLLYVYALENKLKIKHLPVICLE